MDERSTATKPLLPGDKLSYKEGGVIHARPALDEPTGQTRLFENRIELLTVEELAGVLGLAPKTIRNYVARRAIPFLRVGRRTLFRLKSIEAWLERKERKPWQ